MKKKSIVSAMIFLIASFLALSACQNKESTSDIAKAKTELKTTISKEKSAIEQAKSLFDEKQEFLKKDLTQAQIDKVKKLEVKANYPKSKNKDVEKLKKDVRSSTKEFDSLLTKAQFMFDEQKVVNSWFIEPVLNGSEVKADVAVKKDLKETDLKVRVNKVDKAFIAKVQELQEIAKSQLDDIADAKTAVEKAVKEKKKEDINSAQTAIDKIKNAEVRNELLNKLNDVRKSLNIAVVVPKQENQAPAATNTSATSTNNQNSGSSNGEKANTPAGQSNSNNNGGGGNSGSLTPPPASSSDNGSNSGGIVQPPANSDPEPAPQPEPQPKTKYTVFFIGDTSSEYDIVEGTRFFDSLEEARSFIDDYANNIPFGVGTKGYGVHEITF